MSIEKGGLGSLRFAESYTQDVEAGSAELRYRQRREIFASPRLICLYLIPVVLAAR